MNKKTILGIALLILMTSGSLFALDDTDDRTSCKNNKSWMGSYTRPVDIDGLPYVEQLQLLDDGSVIFYATYYLEQPVQGTSTPGYGRWTCRQDGKIAATVLFGSFGPFPPDVGGIGPTLHFHARTTLLLSIVDANSLSRESIVFRIYERGEDPTDPNGGTLYPPVLTQQIYSRLTVNEVDLGQ